MQRTVNTLLLVLTAAATIYAAWMLVDAGSTMATIVAAVITVFVAVSWSQAAALHRRGDAVAARVLLGFTLTATVVFVALADLVGGS